MTDLASAPVLAPCREKLAVQAYPPDHWAVAKAGFQTAGQPTIYLQKPDGTVLHRQDGYEGPEKLFEAVRKADPTYDPAKDPNLTKPAVIPDLGGHLPACCVIGAVALLIVLKRKGGTP